MTISYLAVANWFTGGTHLINEAWKEVTITVAVGDLVVACGMSANANGTGNSLIATQAGPGTTTTWTVGDSNNDSETPGFTFGYAEATGAGNITIRTTVPVSGAGMPMGACLWKVPAAEWGGIPAIAGVGPHDTDSRISANPPNEVNILYGGADWSAADPGFEVFPLDGFIDESQTDDTNYGILTAEFLNQPAGANTFGANFPGGSDWKAAILVVEVGGGEPPPEPAIGFLQTETFGNILLEDNVNAVLI